MKIVKIPRIITFFIFLSIFTFQFLQPNIVVAEDLGFSEVDYIAGSTVETNADVEDNVWESVTDWFDSVGKDINEVIEEIKEFLKSIVSYISDLIESIESAISVFTEKDTSTDRTTDKRTGVNDVIDQSKDRIKETKEEKGSNEKVVYRVLREDENPAKGIFAKAPEREQITIAGHVNNGGKKNFKGSKYISTTKSFEIALKNAKWDIMNKKPLDLRIVQIDLNKVTNKYYDLTDPKVQEEYLVTLKGEPFEKVRRYANASQELLVEYSIPPSAIKLLGRPSELEGTE